MEKKIYAALNSIGAYVPSKIITNDDLSKIVDTSDEWIQKRTGIKERRFAEATEATSDLATKAARIALQRAKLNPEQIDMVILATISPDFFVCHQLPVWWQIILVSSINRLLIFLRLVVGLSICLL